MSVDSSQNIKAEQVAAALELAAFSEAPVAVECVHVVHMACLQQPMCGL